MKFKSKKQEEPYEEKMEQKVEIVDEQIDASKEDAPLFDILEKVLKSITETKHKYAFCKPVIEPLCEAWDKVADIYKIYGVDLKFPECKAVEVKKANKEQIVEDCLEMIDYINDAACYASDRGDYLAVYYLQKAAKKIGKFIIELRYGRSKDCSL